MGKDTMTFALPGAARIHNEFEPMPARRRLKSAASHLSHYANRVPHCVTEVYVWFVLDASAYV